MGASLKERELHELILQKDDLAFAKLFDLYGELIYESLYIQFNSIARRDGTYIYEAVSEAFLTYYHKPSAYDPAKSSLKTFLILVAKRDLQNLLRKDKNYLNNIELPDDVELEEKKWNTKGNDTFTDTGLIQTETVELIESELRKYFHTEQDIHLAKMVISKERKTEEFAEILEITNLPENEVSRAVKRHKDRIKKVLERNRVEYKLKELVR